MYFMFFTALLSRFISVYISDRRFKKCPYSLILNCFQFKIKIFFRPIITNSYSQKFKLRQGKIRNHAPIIGLYILIDYFPFYMLESVIGVIKIPI